MSDKLHITIVLGKFLKPMKSLEILDLGTRSLFDALFDPEHNPFPISGLGRGVLGLRGSFLLHHCSIDSEPL